MEAQGIEQPVEKVDTDTTKLRQRRKMGEIKTSPITSPKSNASKVSPTSEQSNIVNFSVPQRKKRI